jgi:cytochrome b6-f complex iron-sulfur subunit
MERRKFLSWVGLGWLASSLPVALAACTPEAPPAASPSPAAQKPASPASPSPAQPTAGFIQVGTVAQLDAGPIVDPKSPLGPIAVVRAAGKVVALDTTCPHKGCVTSWQAAQSQFVCPCHAATFTADGTFVKGPTQQSLKAYEAKVEGSSVLVRAKA